MARTDFASRIALRKLSLTPLDRCRLFSRSSRSFANDGSSKPVSEKQKISDLTRSIMHNNILSDFTIKQIVSRYKTGRCPLEKESTNAGSQPILVAILLFTCLVACNNNGSATRLLMMKIYFVLPALLLVTTLIADQICSHRNSP